MEEKTVEKKEVKSQMSNEEVALRAATGYFGNILRSLGSLSTFEKSANYMHKWETISALEDIRLKIKDMEAMYKGRLIHGQ